MLQGHGTNKSSIRFSFLCLFLEWVRVGLNEARMSMVDLVNWSGVVSVSLHFVFFVLILPFGPLVHF